MREAAAASSAKPDLKRPPNAFQLFYKDLGLQEGKAKEQLKEASRQWKELTPDQKAPFLKQARALKEDVLSKQQELAQEEAKKRSLTLTWEPTYLSKVQFQAAPGEDRPGPTQQVEVKKEAGADVIAACLRLDSIFQPDRQPCDRFEICWYHRLCCKHFDANLTF